MWPVSDILTGKCCLLFKKKSNRTSWISRKCCPIGWCAIKLFIMVFMYVLNLWSPAPRMTGLQQRAFTTASLCPSFTSWNRDIFLTVSQCTRMYKKTQVNENTDTRDVLDAQSIHQLSSDAHRIQGPCACQNIIWILPISSWHLELENTTLGITYMVCLQRSWRTLKHTTTSDRHKCVWRLHHPLKQLFQTYRLQPHEDSWW